MNKEFKVKEFAEKYGKNSDALKDTFLKNNLKTEKYIGYSLKMDAAKRIVESTSLAMEPVIKDGKIAKKENGEPEYQRKNRIKIDSNMRYILYVYTIIQMYTNIDIDGGKMLDEFDVLNKAGLIEAIFSKIPEKEIKEFSTVLQMTYDDFIQNNCNAQAFVSNQVQRFTEFLGLVLQPIIDKFSDLDQDEMSELVKELGGMADKIKVVK